jgi:hypothetical protein
MFGGLAHQPPTIPGFILIGGLLGGLVAAITGIGIPAIVIGLSLGLCTAMYFECTPERER